MKSLSILSPLVLVLPLIAACSGGSRENLFVNDAEPDAPSSITEGAAWKELKSPMPPWPNDSDLADFEVSNPTTSLKFFVDTKHLSVGKDEVVRYTLVARSNSGASNVSFEGIRCTLNGDYKIYGYGTGNRLKPAAEMDWRRVGKSGPESYRDDLWRYHFCVRRSTTPRPVKDMIRSLKGSVMDGADTGFLTD